MMLPRCSRDTISLSISRLDMIIIKTNLKTNVTHKQNEFNKKVMLCLLAFLVAAIWPTANVAAFVAPTSTFSTLSVSLQLAKAEKTVDRIHYRGENCDDEYDAIVIGSGIGGMTTASLLSQSKEKLKVLLLEQHDVAGGCCHTFKRGGYSFPTGIHYIGEMHEGDGLNGMLRALTLAEDPILWDQIDSITDAYDTIVLGSGDDLRHYRIVGGGIEKQAQELKKQFPTETHAAIDRYYSHIERAAAALYRANTLKCLPLPITKLLRLTGLYRLLARDFRKYASKSLADVVNRLTDNEDLRAVMMYNWEDYGCEPSRAAFIHHARIAKHFSGSAFFPRGGPDSVAQKIIPSITTGGGKVLTGAPVKRVLLDEDTGRAIGVEMMDGRVIRAKRAVVSDAGIVNTIKHLLSGSMIEEKLFQKYFGSENNGNQHISLHEGSSALNLFVGLKGDQDSDFNLPRGNLWTYPNSHVEQPLRKLENISLDEAVTSLSPKDVGLVFISSSSRKDSAWKDRYPGRTVLEIMTCAPYKWFEEYAPTNDDKVERINSDGTADPGGRPGSHGQKYKQRKEELSQLIWQRVVEMLEAEGASNLPQTLDGTDYHELGTPLTFAHFYRREKGGFYGLDHDLSRFTTHNFCEVLRPEIQEIPGLYFTGQDISICGFGGALAGGVMSAGKILGLKNPFSIIDEINESRLNLADA